MSLISRLRTALSLSGAERILAVRAAIGLVGARCALAVFGFPRVERSLESVRVRHRREPAFAREVRRAVQRGARTIPGSTCVPQAIVATRMLRQAGLPATLTIGVARGPSVRSIVVAEPHRALDAHAWVQSGELVVIGDGDLERFTEIAAFDAPE